ncbi:hypothetical protein G3T14_02490 [Methylobacterium sp. BTF04]|uniref:hypothetical protein n=1 Tax=Methylobacterium sp. BTF04 TaxID=2708300 RepID=UPI0013D43FEE|nr:hypothetical protein [Methylobacterium sp. BTF04]NEU11000.1 hypothetical protein [Methylobacterium sp. BTF04]
MTDQDTSPEALLKQVITSAKAAHKPAAPTLVTEAAVEPARIPQPKAGLRFDPRLIGLVGGALAIGVVLGAGAASLAGAHGDRSGDTFVQVQTSLDAARGETERTQAQVERIGKSISQVQDSGEATRIEARTRGTALTERITRAEQALTGKIAALADKLEQAEKEQAAQITAWTAQSEKRPAVQVSASPAAGPVTTTQSDPTQTGALADKPKPSPTENWAVREVYDGIAMLEDRKRRLVEVGPGDVVPGVGRIEAIERRGKSWVVVTRQGTITPQTW